MSTPNSNKGSHQDGGDKRNISVDAAVDDGLNSLAWTESPEEEYFKHILKDEKKMATTKKQAKEPQILQTLSSSPLVLDSKGNRKRKGDVKKKTSSGDENDDEGTLPDAIKLMDEINVEESPKPPPSRKRSVKKGVLEKLFTSNSKESNPNQPVQGSSKERLVIDALAFEQNTPGDDPTINQMIEEMEQQEEEIMFGESSNHEYDGTSPAKGNSDDDLLRPSLKAIRRSLLPAMNAGQDERSTNESLAGQNTVNDIILKMENGDTRSEMMEHLEDGTIRTWTNFNPIARSVASKDNMIMCDNDENNNTTPVIIQGAVRRHTSFELKNPQTTKKNFFVDDDTSVGSFTREIEVVLKKRRSRNYDRENDGDTITSYGNPNTLVSSLSYDETYYRLGIQQNGNMPKTDEEAPWWIVAERPMEVNESRKLQGSDSNDTPSPQNSVKLKLPMTPSTHNSESQFDHIHPIVSHYNDVPMKNFSYEKSSGICEFIWQSLRDNRIVRCLVLLSALCFAAFVGLGVAMLMSERSDNGQANDLSSTASATPPPFNIVFEGSNVTFDYNGANVTSMPSLSPSQLEASPSPVPTTEEEYLEDEYSVSPSLPLTASPTRMPNAFPESLSPSRSPAVSSPPPSTSKTFSPSGRPSATVVSPTTSFPPEDEDTANLIEAIGARLPAALEAMNDSSTPQYRALQWVVANPPGSQDPLLRQRRMLQRWVLAVFYYSTSGEAWVNTSGWLTGSNECSWYSTSPDGLCNDSGLIKEIDLRRNGLRGTVPEELILLTENLESIRINGNDLGGTIPHFISRLNKLERLHLNGNRFVGTIPPSLGALSSTLWSLRLGQMDMVGPIPSQLGSLSKLEYLFLANNRIVGTIPTNLGRLSKLVELELFDNQLSGTIPTEISYMTSLVSLELDQNRFGGTIDPVICSALGAPQDATIEVDCGEVSCSCCQRC